MNTVRDCLVCGEPIPVRQHQAPSARACSPGCARSLAVRENPDLESRKKLVPLNAQLVAPSVDANVVPRLGIQPADPAEFASLHGQLNGNLPDPTEKEKT